MTRMARPPKIFCLAQSHSFCLEPPLSSPVRVFLPGAGKSILDSRKVPILREQQSGVTSPKFRVECCTYGTYFSSCSDLFSLPLVYLLSCLGRTQVVVAVVFLAKLALCLWAQRCLRFSIPKTQYGASRIAPSALINCSITIRMAQTLASKNVLSLPNPALNHSPTTG